MSIHSKRLSQDGFTGIELLIVLTIVIIVSLLVVNNIQEALAKGRDIERRTELNAIQDSLEEHWHANESYPMDLSALGLEPAVLTDPSGNAVFIAAASASANKPASSYAQASSQPEQEYTYAPYECGPANAPEGQTESDEAAQPAEEGGNEEADEAEVTEATAEADGQAPLEVCRKYVIYSWLEKVEIERIPYEVNNQHNTF